MALPKLNETPKYELNLPSTGQKIKFRPYLVKEEKVLMLAAETKDTAQIMSAIMDTIQACVQTPLNLSKLTTFDIEYLFIKLRSKSVGEVSNINLACKSCKEPNEYTVDLESIECVGGTKSKIIELDDKISVQMKYPSYEDIDFNEDESSLGFKLLASSIEAVITDDERISLEDETPESIREFLESMTKDQFDKLSDFLLDMPQVKHEVKFDCTKCGNHNQVELKGIQSFF